MMENNKNANLFKSLFWVFGIILPILLIWVLFGEINSLGLNWIVSFGGKYYDNEAVYPGFFVWNHNNIFNPLFLIFPFILIPVDIFIFYFLYRKNIYFVNQFNSWLSFLLTGFVFIFSSLIGNQWWHIIIRTFIIISTLAILFFTLNFIGNKIMITSKNKYSFLSNILKKEKQEKEYHNELEDLKIYKKEKKDSDVSSIAIEDN